MSALTDIFRGNRFRPDDLPGFENKLFFEGERQQPYLVKFFVLLFLSTVIAAYGILNDSPATVIGAMIVAPLMTPILASAAALVMGAMTRSVRSLLLVGAGVVLIVTISWLIGASYGFVVSFSQTSQITARISPRATDLAIALASGAAGAFAFSRDDIADSLPGVAIAISLVPPLCVLGISLSQGQWDAAWGAMLLFMTNFLAILLAGGGVLAILGLGHAATQTLIGNARRNAFYVIGVGVLLVTIPLSATSMRIASDSWIQSRTVRVINIWLQGSQYKLQKVDILDNGVTVTIVGEGSLPSITELRAKLPAKSTSTESMKLQIVPIEIKQIELPETE